MALSRSARFSRLISREGPLILLVARKVEVEIQTRVNVSSLLLKGEPPRSPLGIGLVPQSSYNFIPLSNQSYLLMKVPTQSTALPVRRSAEFTASEASRRASFNSVILSRNSSLAARSFSLDSRSSPWDVMSSSLTI